LISRELRAVKPSHSCARPATELGRRALEHDAAVAHHVDTVRQPHRDRRLCPPDQDAAPGDLGDQVADR
jgi:hypothetical protein